MERYISLDDMSASELNAAIDATNFPKINSSAASTPLDPNIVSQALGLGLVAGLSSSGPSTPIAQSITNNNVVAATEAATVNGESTSNATTVTAAVAAVAATNGTAKGLLRREHPTPLKMVSFREDKFDVPGTPRTPRTSTTPGRF